MQIGGLLAPSRTRKRLVALAATIGLVAVLAPLMLAGPVQANHNGTLQVTPEVSSVAVDTPRQLDALLVTSMGAAETADNEFDIHWEFVGGPADTDGKTFSTPDATCTMEVGSGTCDIDISASASGTTLVYAWINHRADQLEVDQEEGRLSSATNDCNTELSPGAFAACQDDTAVAGSQGERDGTDVVVVNFIAGEGRLDCSPEVSTAPRLDPGDVTCAVADSFGTPVSGMQIDGENLDGANDPDESGAAGSPDYDGFCTTGASGTCEGEVSGSKGQEGPAEICFWMDSDADDDDLDPIGDHFDPDGAPEDGGDCDVEARSEAESTDVTDVVAITWESRVPTSVNASPETASLEPGDTHTIETEVRDQFGTLYTAENTVVRFEFFSGSPRDTDGNSASSADRSCNTNPGTDTGDARAKCSTSYVSSEEGTDRVCAWIDLDPSTPAELDEPSMSGNSTAGSCEDEDLRGTGTPAVDVVIATWAVPAPPPPPPPTGELGYGYWLVAEDGGIFSFGDADFHGSTGAITLNQPIVGMTPTSTGNGYWFVAADGGIFAFGDAAFHGSMGGTPLNQPIVGMEATPSGGGYWLVASDGGIFGFGDAAFHGSTGGTPLNQPIVGMTSTPSGNGYWFVASDGGIFSFGDAAFHGSMGGTPLNQPIVGMDATPTGSGYWLVAADGGVFAFDAPFHGSTGDITLNQPIVGMTRTESGSGYWFVASDGGIFSFGDAKFAGSMGGTPLNKPIVGMAALP